MLSQEGSGPRLVSGRAGIRVYLTQTLLGFCSLQDNDTEGNGLKGKLTDLTEKIIPTITSMGKNRTSWIPKGCRSRTCTETLCAFCVPPVPPRVWELLPGWADTLHVTTRIPKATVPREPGHKGHHMSINLGGYFIPELQLQHLSSASPRAVTSQVWQLQSTRSHCQKRFTHSEHKFPYVRLR